MLITLIVVVIVLVIFITILVGAIARLANELPSYADKFESVKESIEDFLSSLELEFANVDLTAVTDFTDPGKLMNFVLDFVLGIVDALSNIFIIALIFIFMLVDAMGIPSKMAGHLKDEHGIVQRSLAYFREVRQYLGITTIVGIAAGILDTILFILLGVDFPILWGMFAFMLSYIPSLGFWIALIPPVILALLKSGPLVALLVFIGVVVINGFAENVVKPRYMGADLNLSPFTIIFSVLF